MDNILDKECFHHVNVGNLLFEELKNPILNNSIYFKDKGRKGRQKLLNAWQNGELLDSVRKQQSYYLNMIYEKNIQIPLSIFMISTTMFDLCRIMS